MDTIQHRLRSHELAGCSNAHREILRRPFIHAPRPSDSKATHFMYQDTCNSVRVRKTATPLLHTRSGIERLLCRSSTSYSSNGATKQRDEILKETTALVETAMLAAVSGLAYLVSTILKIENTVGYFLPLPVVLASMRSGVRSGWKTMSATAFLLVVLLGPLRAVSYLLLHGLVAATLGTLWKLKVGWWTSIAISSLVRMVGQLSYLLLSSVTMNENFFWVILNSVYTMLDQISAAVGGSGAPSTTAVASLLFSLLLVNSTIYVFLLHVVYRLVLQGMGYSLGPLPGIISKYLYAGMAPEMRQQLEQGKKQQ